MKAVAETALRETNSSKLDHISRQDLAQLREVVHHRKVLLKKPFQVRRCGGQAARFLKAT